ncbi:MAG: hypothetical protein R3C17_13035 [Planctomycetaceae bacterium]
MRSGNRVAERQSWYCCHSYVSAGTKLKHPLQKAINEFRQPHPGPSVFLSDSPILFRHRHQLVVSEEGRFAIVSPVHLATIDFDAPGITGFATDRF